MASVLFDIVDGAEVVGTLAPTGQLVVQEVQSRVADAADRVVESEGELHVAAAVEHGGVAGDAAGVLQPAVAGGRAVGGVRSAVGRVGITVVVAALIVVKPPAMHFCILDFDAGGVFARIDVDNGL